MRRKLRVLFAAFEAVPFMKTGGLGDVGGSLPQALRAAGCECRVIIPKFMTIPEEYKSKMTHVTDFYVSLGWRNVYCGIEKLTHKGVVYYFVDNEYGSGPTATLTTASASPISPRPSWSAFSTCPTLSATCCTATTGTPP